MHLNEVIYKEGDQVDGMYLQVKGSLKYQKLIVDQVPNEVKTKSKLFRDTETQQVINRKRAIKDVLEAGDLLSFEEILRNYIQIRQDE